MLFEAIDPSDASGASVPFEPGARTAWHAHPRGQILIVTAGTGRVQRWGDPIEVIRPGDVVRIPAGAKHWHGAAAQASMTHFAIAEHRDQQLDGYLRRALDSGLIRSQITEAFTHLGFYAGWPKAIKAMSVVTRSLGK